MRLKRWIPVACLNFCLFASAGGQVRRYTGNGFSFNILVPEGWTADSQGAPQLAHFVMHDQNFIWREAPSVLYFRLVPVENPDEQLREFVEASLADFAAQCPTFERRMLDWELDSPHQFLVSRYSCIGSRPEISAVSRVPHYFILMVLSGKSDSALDADLPKLEEIVSVFEWTTLPSRTDLPRPDPPG